VQRFRKEFILRPREVSTVYPDAQLEIVRGRHQQVGGSLLLRPSRPPVCPSASVIPAAIGARAETPTESREGIRATAGEQLPEGLGRLRVPAC